MHVYVLKFGFSCRPLPPGAAALSRKASPGSSRFAANKRFVEQGKTDAASDGGMQDGRSLRWKNARVRMKRINKRIERILGFRPGSHFRYAAAEIGNEF